ncbi:MAG: Tol-Pal system beta propeller repeat protein TolB [Deltaproteobacteria bacterium]|nr:Tol-Pal system beta propeller repeat protein TolB [Deltaproteobacteria bacterium]
MAHRLKHFIALMLVGWLLAAGHAYARIYIDITSPQTRKISIAVPYFRPLAEATGSLEAGKKFSDTLTNALVFHGIFTAIDPAIYGGSDTSDWSALGAEFVIKGNFKSAGDRLILEMALIDVAEGKIALGRRYEGEMTNYRAMLHRFCDVVIQVLTGEPGISQSKIAFIWAKDSHKEIYVADFDGENARRITSERSIVLSPRFSPDAEEMVYTSYREGRPILYIKNLYTGKSRRLADFKGINVSPAWSPDGKFLAVALTKDGSNSQLYLIDRQGSIIRRLTNNWGINVSPTWSPDGKQLAYVSDSSGSPQIYILDLQSLHTRRLTFDGSYNTAPAWSPRGDCIAYNGMKGRHFDVYTIDVQSGKVTQLTGNAGNNECPSWSPDSRQMVFSSTRAGEPQLFVMFADGSGQRRIINSVRPGASATGAQTQPCWSRRLN